MKRPLFWVCLFLVVTAVLHLFCSPAVNRERAREAALAGRSDLQGEVIMVSGRVWKREEKAGKLSLWVKIQKEKGAPAQVLDCFQAMQTDGMICVLAEPGGTVPRIGNEILLEGRFYYYDEATNPGEFNTAAYYQGMQVGGKLLDAEILRLGAEYDLLGEGLFLLREHWAGRLDAAFAPKEAGVMRTLLLGDRTELDPELKELYREGGILHILSISGLHITLLGMGVHRLLRRLGVPVGVAAGISGAILFLYGIMTGMSVSAYRAIGMFLLRMISEICGRSYDLPTALSALAALMLCTEPLRAMQSGFWLSFGALAGIGLLLPVLEGLEAGALGDQKPGEGKILTLLRKFRNGTWSGLRAGLSVSLCTLPILLMVYYEIPVYSMLVNLLVVPVMGPLVFIGFLVMLLPFMGFLGGIDSALLRYFEVLCGMVRRIPFHSWNPGCPEKWQIVLYYVMLAGILWGLHALRKRRGKWIGWYLRVGVCLPVLIFLLPIHGGTKVTFLDVGQGDGACIQTARGQVFLCDCGSSNRSGVGEYVLTPFLKHEGISKIDAVFLSHGDYDHVSGIVELLLTAQQEGISVKTLVLPALPAERTQEEFGMVLAAAAKVPGLKIYQMGAGDRMDGKEICFFALHPSVGGSDGLDANEASLCLYVTMAQNGGSLDALFLGDVEGEGENRLLAQLSRLQLSDVTLLKCAHHGSRNATSEAFLNQVDAALAVISCGRRNRYGHPHAQTLIRLQNDGSQIFRTDEGGAITVSYDGKRCSVRSFR